MSTPVTVGCKLPNGLVLKVGKAEVTIKGANDSRIIGGYGLTTVPSDFWEAWLAEYKDSSLVLNKIVFAQSTTAKAEAQAKEQEGVRTNLEPLKTDADRTGAPITRR